MAATDKPSPFRLFLGLAVQPFAAAALGFVMFPILELMRSGGIDSMRGAVSVALGAGLIAFMVTLLGALPMVMWCAERGRLTLPWILGGGVVLGNVPIAILWTLAALEPNRLGGGASPFDLLSVLRPLIAGTVFGLSGAALFWVIAVRRFRRT